jgi:hypothetical protein
MRTFNTVPISAVTAVTPIVTITTPAQYDDDDNNNTKTIK